jgi:hypothetical protein
MPFSALRIYTVFCRDGNHNHDIFGIADYCTVQVIALPAFFCRKTCAPFLH